MSILKEILSATGEKKQGPKESDDQFRTRVFGALNTMSDDDWADLSDPAQKWSNDAGDAMKKKKPLPDFEVEEEEEEEEEESEGSEIEFSELEEGQEVTIKSGTGKELAKGEVSAVSKTSVTILGDDGEETEVKKAKAAAIVLHGGAAEEEEEEEEDETPKGRRKTSGRRDDDTPKKKAGAKSKKQDEEEEEEEEEEEDETPKSKKKADKKPAGKKAKDEEEEEEEEELEQWENEIDQDDVKVGMTVQLYFEADESLVQGEVTKVGPKGIFIDGERYMKDDITNVYVEEVEEDEEETPKSKKKAGAKEAPKRGKKIVEDGEEEEEEEEEDGDAGAELPFKKLKKDMTVTVHLKDGSTVSGDITRLGMPDGKTLKGIFIDGERIAVVKIAKVTEGASGKKASKKADAKPAGRARGKDDDDDKADGKKAKTGVVQAIKEVCCKFPALSEEKVQARLEKAGHEVNPSTLKMTYKDVHTVIDMLRENGKLA